KNCTPPPTNVRYRTLIGVLQSETRHQLRAPIRSRLTYLKEGARYGARSDIRRACRKTARRYLRRNYERHPYMVGSPPHPASLVPGMTIISRSRTMVRIPTI